MLSFVQDDDSAEDEIDRALEAVLDAELEADDYCEDGDEDEDGEWEDVDEDEEDEEDDENDGKETTENGSESDELSAQEEVPSRRKRSFSVVDKDLDGSSHQTKPRQLPKNFSRIDTSLPTELLQASFPLYLEAKKHAITVTIKAGEMLYIPCGWFHEVQSLGGGGHIALNYWFHPPDNNKFEQPYENNFWRQTFETRKKIPSKPIL